MPKKQLSPVPVPEDYTLEIQPVPHRKAIEDGRFWIVVRGTDKSFQIPVQWTAEEAAFLIHEIRGVSWQLNEEGVPRAYWQILKICEDFVNDRLKDERFR